MLSINTLKPAPGANRKNKRVGRGIGSGHSKTATRGYNGQHSRAGSKMRPGFEGGQMPLYRRLPKRGFTNIFRKEYVVVNLEQLAAFDAGAEIDPVVLRDRGIIKNLRESVKILGDGDLDKALKVRAHKFSKGAAEKIQKAGGSVEVIA
ncbi:MAG: 50S ribosomal protein L15 [Acidobacteriota bacterium]|jgi:large subunit ribosomal protein L15|nr:50S ribosomal protein L15 [Acidobacteriota bacterium]